MHDVPVTVIPRKDWDYYCKPPPQINSDVSPFIIGQLFFLHFVHRMQPVAADLKVMTFFFTFEI